MAHQIEVFGQDGSADTRRTRSHLDKLGADYRYVDLDRDAAAATEFSQPDTELPKTPVVRLTGDGDGEPLVLFAPTNTELDYQLDRLGLLPLETKGDGSPGT